MRYILRADASPLIGAGHVMRSSVIAEELIAQGMEVVFLGKISDLPWVSKRIDSLGFSQVLPSSENLISDPKSDVLILDSYTLPVDDVFIQQKNWKAIVAILDGYSPPYTSDLRIQLSLNSEAMDKFKTKTLFGPKYIPIRKTLKENLKLEENDPLNILVVGGGANTFDFAIVIAFALKKISTTFNAKIFTDSIVPKTFDSRFVFTRIGEIYDELTLSADLAFTTASTVCLELLAQGVPIGIGCAVENQEQFYRELSGLKIAAPIGQFESGEWRINAETISNLVNLKTLRRELHLNAEGLVDFEGGKRIVNEILKL
jgi:spore coat polysaccharide biosynthesis predicted glycosyltransferase SpsG